MELWTAEVRGSDVRRGAYRIGTKGAWALGVVAIQNGVEHGPDTVADSWRDVLDDLRHSRVFTDYLHYPSNLLGQAGKLSTWARTWDLTPCFSLPPNYPLPVSLSPCVHSLGLFETVYQLTRR